MKVVILIPVYKVEKYIEECAKSLFEQTYYDIMFVFCDDCTPDDSIKILKATMAQYPQRIQDIKIIQNKENIGIGVTRANLLKYVDSDYFMFVDSDDVLAPDAVEKLVKKIEETNVDYVEGAFCEINKGLQKNHFPYHGSDKKFNSRILCQNIEYHNVWGKIYNKSVINKINNLFIEGIDMAEDYCAMAKISSICSRSWIDDVIYYYRTDNVNSYSNRITEKSLMSYCKSSKVVLDFYSQQMKKHNFALEIGLLNIYRSFKLNGVSFDKADQELMWIPDFFSIKLLLKMIKNDRIPYMVTNNMYKFLRLFAIL